MSDAVGIDAGVEPAPGLGGAGSSGAAGASGVPPVRPPEGAVSPRDGGLSPTAGPPLPGGAIIEVPPGCDGGVATGCSDSPAEQPPPADACDDCLADVCPADLARCDETEGCDAIVDCARRSGCELDACYCGSFNELLCTTTGQANGPCRDVMLAAPGAHPPSFVEPNVGPAAEAARSVGACRLESDACRDACGG